MRHIAIDVTPLAINRTAMHYITRDTLRWMFSRFDHVVPYALGIELQVDELVANDFLIRFDAEREIRANLARILNEGASAVTGYRRTFATALPTFVLDPLYVLFVPPTSRTLALVLDLTPLTHPQWHHPIVCALYKEAFERLGHPMVEVAAISESTARDLWANLGIPPTRTGVLPLYNRFDAGTLRTPPQGGPLLYVGSLEDRKNVTGLISAYGLTSLAKQGIELHLVGGDGHGHESIRARADGVPGVVIRGRVSDGDLNQAYRECRAFVLPSYWEGFGLPALEALAQGVPTLISETGALPEIGAGIATIVDPCDIRSISEGLIQVSMFADQIATDDERRAVWHAQVQARLSKYKFERFTSNLAVQLTRVADESKTNEALRRSTAENHGSGLVSPHRAPSRSLRILRSLRQLVVPAGDVPTDSYSAEYLFRIQEAKRLALADALGQIRLAAFKQMPKMLFVVVVRYVSLLLTNAFVRAAINEILLKKHYRD